MLEWTVIEQNVMKEGFNISSVYCVTLSENGQFVIPPNKQRLENYLLVETSELFQLTKKHSASFLMHIPFFEKKEDAEKFKNEILPLWESAKEVKNRIDKDGVLYEYYDVYSLETKLFDAVYKNHLANESNMDFMHLQKLSTAERSERYHQFNGFSSTYEKIEDATLKEFLNDLILAFISDERYISGFTCDLFIKKKEIENDNPVYSILISHKKNV